MSDPDEPTGFSLRRWSRRKREAAREARPVAQPPAVADAPSAVAASPDDVHLESAGTPAGNIAPPAHPKPQSGDCRTPIELPPVESMTIDSDFTPFMQPGVDESLKRSALKKLFSDPRFNVMDGLDVYIDDYSKPDPIDPAIVRTLAHARYIFDPPKTRVNAQGHVEDVPEEAQAEAAEALADSTAPAVPGPASAGNAVPASTLSDNSGDEPTDMAPAIPKAPQ